MPRTRERVDASSNGVAASTVIDTSTSLDELHEQTTKQLMAAYTEENMTYSGSYLTQVRSITEKRNADDAEYDAGRQVYNLAVTYLDVDDPTTRCGTGFIKASPELRYTASGRLDNASKRFAELAKAVLSSVEFKQLLQGTLTAAQVFEKVQQSMFMTKVRESYMVTEDELHSSHANARINPFGDAWVTLAEEDTDERDHYLSLGLEPKIMVDRIYKVKAEIAASPAGQEAAAYTRNRATSAATPPGNDDIPF